MSDRHRCDDGAFPCENDLYDWGEMWSPFLGDHRLSTATPTQRPLQWARHQPDHDRLTHTLDQAYPLPPPPLNSPQSTSPISPALDFYMADVAAPSASSVGYNMYGYRPYFIPENYWPSYAPNLRRRYLYGSGPYYLGPRYQDRYGYGSRRYRYSKNTL